jgi:hypothetical protein
MNKPTHFGNCRVNGLILEMEMFGWMDKPTHFGNCRVNG